MASVREFKKDIDYLIFEVISDCFTYMEVNGENKNGEIDAIISDAVGLRNNLIARVNNPAGKDNPKVVRTYFQSVKRDLIDGADTLFDRLSALSVKAKAE
jgi:hypothetical protein